MINPTAFTEIVWPLAVPIAFIWSSVKEAYNKLVKHWEFKGKHTGTFFGIPATGKDIDVFGVTIAKMRGGKIAEEQDFMDNLEFMQQLGLMPR